MNSSKLISDQENELDIIPDTENESDLPFFVTGIGASLKSRRIEDSENENNFLVFSISGIGELSVDDLIYTITPGTSFFVPAGMSFEYRPTDGDWATNWISFKGEACKNTLRKIGLSHAAVTPISNMGKFNRRLREIYNTLTRDEMYGGLMASGLIYNLILQYSRILCVKEAKKKPQSALAMNTLINYIEQNYSTDITLQTLCEVAQISPQHLCRMFKKTVGMRPMEYIAKKRVEEAKKLLTSTPYNVTKISNIVGFNNCNYFCIVFKKFESVSPTQYRRINGNRFLEKF